MRRRKAQAAKLTAEKAAQEKQEAEKLVAEEAAKPKATKKSKKAGDA